MKKVLLVGTLFIVIFLLLAVAYKPTPTLAAPPLPRSMRIATHPQGAAYYVLGSAFAKVLSKHLPLSATVRPFSGFQAWFPEVNRGDVDAGLATGYDLWLGVQGREPYKKMSNLRILSVGTDLILGLAVKKDSPIKTLADLKGKRVTINQVLMGARDGALAQIRAAGLDPERDIIVVPVTNVVQPPQYLMEGRVDAAWAAPAMPQIREAAARLGGVRFLPAAVNKEQARQISEQFTGYRVLTIKGGILTGVDKPTPLMASSINLVTHKNLSDEAAYRIIKTLWDNYDDYKGAHPWARLWTHKKMTANLVHAVAPFHAGAVRFYKEQGVWGEKAAQQQQKLLRGR
jgi:TRAP transporter TAXI family solute receptor